MQVPATKADLLSLANDDSSRHHEVRCKSCRELIWLYRKGENDAYWACASYSCEQSNKLYFEWLRCPDHKWANIAYVVLHPHTGEVLKLRLNEYGPAGAYHYVSPATEDELNEESLERLNESRRAVIREFIAR